MSRGAKKRGIDGPIALGAIVLAVMVSAVAIERLTRPQDGMVTGPIPLPPLQVQGWLNTDGGPGPSPEALRGQWVVLDSWATSCPPCLGSMPKLVKFRDKYRDRGVRLVGLTSEPEHFMPQFESVLNRFDGMTWPIGYGAGMVNGKLGVRMIPNYMLFNPEGVSVWTGHTVEGLEAALNEQM